jgi:hypothetical protein
MRTSLTLFVLFSLSAAAPIAAKQPCPARPPGPLPWAIEGTMSGDRFADVYIDIDDHGQPTACRMGQNNIPGDNKFWICQAFMTQFRTQTPAADGQPRHTILRKYGEFGMRHSDAESAARSKFFREHPSERPECYPKSGN